MTEKKFTYILVSLAAIAILVVILLNIPWGGEKAKIAKEFNIDKDHVYVMISEEDLYKKINSGETFQLFVGYGMNPNKTPNLNGQSFAYEANKLAKTYNVEIIYYINYLELNEEQLTNLKEATSFYTEFPSLFYFEGELGEKSIALNISGLKDLEDFDGSLLSLLEQYFKDCYELD
jgi:hypothetical protein